MVDDSAPRPALASFDSAYLGTPPWEIGKPQPTLAALFDAGEVRGRVLDVGCGTGELALLAASRGLEAAGVDSAPRAIAIARTRAAARGLTGVRFEVGDALDLSFLNATFDTALDSGVFHVFSDQERARYVESIRRVLVPGGRYHLVVFSDAEPGDWGPRRIKREELDAAFARGWDLRAVESATFEVNLDDGVVQAWRATAVRI
ncbi:MAG: class I SAM-dependent methyltransferase [Candidatus Dormibacteraeota bacterium]|nr:class I SAM-dependent methyltransferase [Candidatus Dormibacteraeota bacterium]